MARNKTYDIFLSHSSLDNDFTDKLHSLLEQAGFNVWYDEKKMIERETFFIIMQTPSGPNE